jgi:hypothetical protein
MIVKLRGHHYILWGGGNGSNAYEVEATYITTMTQNKEKHSYI